MAHFVLIRNPVTNWSNGSTILQSELVTLAQNLAAAIHSDGGCWAPSSVIGIAGSGVSSTAPLVVTRGGKVTSNATGVWRCEDGDVPTFLTPRTRTVVYPVCLAARGLPAWNWRTRRTDGAVQSIATLIDLSDGRGFQPTRLYVPIRAHHGATLSTLTVSFRVGVAHTAIPSVMPTMRLVRISNAGKVTPLTSQASGADPNGYVAVPKPSSGSAWFAAGATQTLTLPCDQNNVIDRANFTYELEIVEEQLSSGWPFSLVAKKPCTVATRPTDQIDLSSPPGTLDGVTLAAGMRVLLKNQSDATQNGIWNPTPGQWQRATDWQASSDFSQGMILLVDQGVLNMGSYWQAAPSSPTWTPGTLPPGTITWKTPYTPAANSYVVPTPSHATGFYYQCTVSGAVGGTEPVWPNVVGQTVVDNAATWKCTGRTDTAISINGRPDFEPAPDAAYFVPHGNIWQALTALYTGIVDERFQ